MQSQVSRVERTRHHGRWVHVSCDFGLCFGARRGGRTARDALDISGNTRPYTILSPGVVLSLKPGREADLVYGREALGILALTGMALAARLWILVVSGQLSADEAVPGLMARHILRNHELPVFFWGQDYFGSAEAYLIAACTRVADGWPWVVFAPAIVASLVLIPLTAVLANKLHGQPAGIIAAIPIAIPPAVFTRELVTSAGGFSLGFALMMATLLLMLKAVQHPCSMRWIALASLCAGFAMWVWQPALPALTPLLLVVLARMRRWHSSRELLAAVAPVVIGLVPPLLYNASRGWPTLSAMLIKSSDTPLAGDTPLTKMVSLGSLLLTALGGGDDSIGGINLIQACALLIGAIVGMLVVAKGHRGWVLGLTLSFAILHTLAAHEGNRYLVPLVLISCALFGVAVTRLLTFRIGAVVTVLTVAGSNLLTYPAAAPVLAAQDLSSITETNAAVDALQQRGLRYGYADYWTAYPITYLSDEQIIVAPSLPFFWRARTDRYPPYTHQVDGMDAGDHLFVLVDRRCTAAPYLSALDGVGASYRVEVVSRWQLVWNIQPRPGDERKTATALRSAIAEAEC